MKIGFLIVGLLGVLLGILLLFIPVDFLISLMFIVFGVLTLISAIPALIVSLTNQKDRGYLFNIITSLISVVFGLVLIFWHNEIVMVLLGAYMLVFPLIRILLSRQKLQQLKVEIPRMIIGLVMVLIGPGATVSILLRIAGIVIIVLSALYGVFGFVGSIIASNKAKKKTGARVFVDADGDGTVDAVYLNGTSSDESDKNE